MSETSAAPPVVAGEVFRWMEFKRWRIVDSSGQEWAHTAEGTWVPYRTTDAGHLEMTAAIARHAGEAAAERARLLVALRDAALDIDRLNDELRRVGELNTELLAALRPFARVSMFESRHNGEYHIGWQPGDLSGLKIKAREAVDIARAAIAKAEALTTGTPAESPAGVVVQHAYGYAVRHLDGDPENNDLGNLRVERVPTREDGEG